VTGADPMGQGPAFVLFWGGVAVSMAFGWLSVRITLAVLRRTGPLRANYRGDVVPVASGWAIALPAGCVPLLWAWGAGGGTEAAPLAPIQLLVVGGFALLGTVDDIWGSRAVTGLRGHLRALLSGRPTTGAAKAVGGLTVSAAAAWLSGFRGAAWAVALLVMALSANAVNLLDLRPGRALKAAGFLLTSLLPFLPVSAWFHWFPAACAGAALFPHDVRGRAMLGDTGSNVIGALLGLWIVWWVPVVFQVGWLAVLVALHLYAERRSLSELIARVPFLTYLDRLGQPDEGPPHPVDRSQ
jgi:UDP-N-acetylmuramyl pentapeptide phosphotransferase/UDP-N-acetylglucosamine-1-phosphate transferase